MAKRYVVRLDPEERMLLLDLITVGTAAARTQTHARILLKADAGPAGPAWIDTAIAEALEVSLRTVERVREAWVTEGLETALYPQRSHVPRPRKLDGEQEAQLVALACSPPPAGRERWTLRLLANRLVELEVVDAIAPETVRLMLKKNELKPWLTRAWCIPPEQSATFVAHMEDILTVYTRPLDPAQPLVCMDETSKQLIGDVRPPRPVAPGHPAVADCEYERRGTANLFLLCAPLLGWRTLTVTARRARSDWAELMRALVDEHFPDAPRITLVLDNLNTHDPASLYQTFPPAEARRILERLEIHYTPKHGSWLNIAEIEFSVLGRQCLNRRIADLPTLHDEVAAWVTARNADAATIDWRFTTADARIKLKHLYPIQQPVI